MNSLKPTSKGNVKKLTDEQAAYAMPLTPKILEKFGYDLLALMAYAESE
jgi:hypothetical protein